MMATIAKMVALLFNPSFQAKVSDHLRFLAC